jgi:hypothetical protein
MSCLLTTTRSAALLVVAFAAMPGPVNAQQPIPIQQNVYNQHRLSVEPRARAQFGAGRYGASGESWIVWDAWEGYQRISEGDFFRRVGLPQQAQMADSYRQGGKTLEWTGLALTGGGLALMFASCCKNTTMVTVGAALSLGGLVPVFIGTNRLKHNRFPYSSVTGLAAAYNENLRQRILRGEIR